MSRGGFAQAEWSPCTTVRRRSERESHVSLFSRKLVRRECIVTTSAESRIWSVASRSERRKRTYFTLLDVWMVNKQPHVWCSQSQSLQQKREYWCEVSSSRQAFIIMISPKFGPRNNWKVWGRKFASAVAANDRTKAAICWGGMNWRHCTFEIESEFWKHWSRFFR